MAYQEANGVRTPVPVRYVLEPKGGAPIVALDVAAYDTARALVIDPVVSYSRYVGGTGDDSGMAVAVGSAARKSETTFPIAASSLRQGIMTPTFWCRTAPSLRNQRLQRNPQLAHELGGVSECKAARNI